MEPGLARIPSESLQMVLYGLRILWVVLLDLSQLLSPQIVRGVRDDVGVVGVVQDRMD